MEVRLNKRDFLDSFVQGGILSKRAKGGLKHAVELCVSIAKIESNFPLSDECAEKLSEILGLFKKIFGCNGSDLGLVCQLL